MMRVIGVFGVAWLAWLAPTIADADETETAPMIAGARERFREGMREAALGHWEEAHAAFVEVYALVPRPRVLVNLATAQAQTGRLVEAAESYRTALAQVASDAESADMRTQVQSALRDLDARLPRLVIAPTGILPTDRLLLDSEVTDLAAASQPIPVNPGTHTVSIERGSTTLVEIRTLAEEGQTTQVLPVVLAERTPTTTPAAPPGAETPWWKAPWLWATAGAALAVGIGAVVLVSTADGPEERTGNFGTGRWSVK